MSINTLIQNGPSSNRVDIVFLGDGYTSSQLANLYIQDIASLTDYLFSGNALTEPFGLYSDYFNVTAINVASNENGADDPSTGTFRDTALGSTYFYDGVTERLLYVDDNAAKAAMNAALAGTGIDAEMRFVTVNNDKYGGGGGYFAVYSGGNENALEVAVHEVGHSFAGLADEYDDGTASNVTFTGGEPDEPNVTKDASGAKWSRWIGFEQEGLGTVGAFEGGMYADHGIFRPTFNSKMRELNQPFDPIAREAFVLNFYKYVDPLDDHAFSNTTGTLFDIDGLWVDTISDKTIRVDWLINGQLVSADTTSIDFSNLGLGAGTYNITAHAYDDTGLVRIVDPSLEEYVSWTVQLTGDTTLPGTLPNWYKSDADFEVVASTYQFFTGTVPIENGFEYLISSPDNATDLNDSYYAQFNRENRFINFANNLGSVGEGNAEFISLFGGLSFEETVALAFDLIIGAQAVIDAGNNPADSILFFLNARSFYEAVALERVVPGGIPLDQATKIVAIGSILNEGLKADLGSYAEAVHDFMADLKLDGESSLFGTDLFA
ncbi:MAG: M64 family metallopeptidase [Rhizobiaceae bacterium]